MPRSENQQPGPALAVGLQRMLDPVRPPCLQLTGALYVPTNGSYTLWLCSDDGSRLWLNDQLLVDNGGLVSRPCTLPWRDHALRSAAATGKCERAYRTCKSALSSSALSSSRACSMICLQHSMTDKASSPTAFSAGWYNIR